MALQVLRPRGRSFIMVNAHPVGCAAQVAAQFGTARLSSVAARQGTALVIGASTGYGLASRVVAAVSGMRTVGVFLERQARGQRGASAGWYNSAAFHQLAGDGHFSINADAFADETKQVTVDELRAARSPVDLVVYSLASPVRADPVTGVAYRSVIKPIGSGYATRNVDLEDGTVRDIWVSPATDEEVRSTVRVMGGDDLRRWTMALLGAGLFARGATVVAYSYIGPRLTWPIYREGTVGEAKKDLEATVRSLDQLLAQQVQGRAVISVNKAVVTQASAAIPAVPLYISLLYKLMKENGSHEGPIEQVLRLFSGNFGSSATLVDPDGRARLDDRELEASVQGTIESSWSSITTDNLRTLTDFDGYRSEFQRLFGFEVPGLDYDEEVETEVDIPGNITVTTA